MMRSADRDLCVECGKSRAGHESDERAALTGWAYHPYSADRTKGAS